LLKNSVYKSDQPSSAPRKSHARILQMSLTNPSVLRYAPLSPESIPESTALLRSNTVFMQQIMCISDPLTGFLSITGKQ
jgi:hypothetical protein